MFVSVSILFVVLLIWLFWRLLKQSKRPTGFLGILMMRLWNSVYLPLVKWAINSVEFVEGSSVLDIGVGNGASSAYLLEQRNILSITGIDISNKAISQAIKKYPTKRIDFETMDIHKLTFSAETFDLVTAFQTHFHWDDLDQALHEIYRVLKPNGVVLFACETTKIHYFLPRFKNSDAFQDYLSKSGFSTVKHQTTAQWTMYLFQKNENDTKRTIA